MRLVIIVALILVLGWLGYETRSRSKELSNICYGIGGILLIILIAVLVVGVPEP